MCETRIWEEEDLGHDHELSVPSSLVFLCSLETG